MIFTETLEGKALCVLDDKIDAREINSFPKVTWQTHFIEVYPRGWFRGIILSVLVISSVHIFSVISQI